MKRLTFLSVVFVIVMWHGMIYGSDFTNPLALMEVVQGFGGAHIGTDLDADAETPIYAIADGRVCYYRADASGYGGGSGTCLVDGEVIFVRHRKGDGSYFIAQYGHIQNVPVEYQVAMFTFNGPAVYQGEQIAEIGVYDPCRDCGPRCDHLHFGIWDSENQIPTSGWGYGQACYTEPEGCWVDPMPFFDNESPYGTYLATYASQTPTYPPGLDYYPVAPGQVLPVEFIFNNDGTAYWTNDVTSSHYVELHSVNSS